MSKDERLGIRVTPEIKAKLEAYAERDGRTVSNLILKILNDWIKEQQIADKKVGVKKGA